MKRIINTLNISDTAKYIKNKIEDLKDAKNILESDIERINSIYMGNDASVIVAKYRERASNLSIVINNYENLYLYMQKISGAYQDNIDRSVKNINSSIEELNSKKIDISKEEATYV